MNLKPFFKICAVIVLLSAMFSEQTTTTYFRAIINLLAISIFIQEDREDKK